MEWDKILDELSYKSKQGYPDLTNSEQLIILQNILLESYGWTIDSVGELLNNLNSNTISSNK